MPAIQHFQASDGYRLAFRHWPAATTPRGMVVALHGIQSHSGWYEHSSRRMAEAGYEVRFLDRRGSGLNEAERGHAAHADRLINDVVQFTQAARFDAGPDVPIILLAVSWGGRLAATVAAERRDLIDGLALLYPGLFPRLKPSRRQLLQLSLAEHLGIRRKLVPIPLDDPALFTSIPEWQEFIRRDPLALRQVTTSFLFAHRVLGERAAAAAPRLSLPLLLMLAGCDRIIDNAATERFFDRVPFPDKRRIIYPDAAHTLEFECSRDKFVDDLLIWLATVPPRPPTGDSYSDDSRRI